MSNYTIITNYAAKDALVSGNPQKLIKGADFTNEFQAIQTAINSKVDGSSVYFTDGSAAQPSVGFTNNAGTGVYNAAGVLNLATGAASRLAISTAGDVTIAAPSSGQALTVTGAANSFAISAVGSATSGQSYGSLILAGTTAADSAVIIANQANSETFLGIHGDGSGALGGTTGSMSWTAHGAAFSFGVPLSSTSSAAFSGTGGAGSSAVTIQNASGGGYGGAWVMSNQSGGATNSQKYFRVNPTGSFEMVNSAFTGVVFSIDDTGAILASNGAGSTAPIYSGIPRNVQNANYQLALTDQAKLIYHSGGSHTWTIPANATTAIPAGSVINLMVLGGSVTLAIGGTDVLQWLPSNATGSRTLSSGCIATLYKVDTTDWTLSGVGIT